MNIATLIGLLLLTQSVQNAETLYYQGKYVEAVEVARETLSYGNLDLTTEIGLLKIVAFSHVALGEITDAKNEFTAILKLDSTVILDPALVSPKIVEVFNEVKEEFDADQPVNNGTLTTIVDTALISPLSLRKAALLSIGFPGAGQLYAGESLKGWCYITIEGLALSGLAVSEVLYLNARKAYRTATDPDEISQLYKPYNNWFRVRNAFAGITVGIWISAPVEILLFPPEWGRNR